METTVVIHSESNEKLLTILKKLERYRNEKNLSIFVHSKNYFPNDECIKYIVNYKTYNAFPTEKNLLESIVEVILKVKTKNILILNEDSPDFSFEKWSNKNHNHLFCDLSDILKLKLDTKYETLYGFIIDLKSQFNRTKYEMDAISKDGIRYLNKIDNPLFNENIIYIDGGLGDHIMALPLLESMDGNLYISCKYPFVFSHIKNKGFIDWFDDLFGGYKRFVYEYGSKNNSKTIIDAFFELYGKKRTTNDILKYNGESIEVQELLNKKLALICTSAAKIQNQDSNKDWRDIRWFKLVHELKKMGYFVVQVGTTKDNQIPNVDYKFLDKPLSELKFVIENSSLWISVDTFFHHFASSIKPNVGICLTPFYNDHAKHPGVIYIEKDCGKDFSIRKWWMDLQQPERKECMDLIQIDDVLNVINDIHKKINFSLLIPVYNNVDQTIEFLKHTLSNSKNINDIVIYSNGTSVENNNKLKESCNEIPYLNLYIVDKPIGFVKAINEGIKLCKNEHILCLNSDASLGPDWEDYLVPLCNNQDNGLIGPVLNNDFILGCCFIVKKSILNKVGLLNEGFGMGYEDDVELSYRIENNGYNLGYRTVKSDLGKSPHINFPIVHEQGNSFISMGSKFVSDLFLYNKFKFETFKKSTEIVVFKNTTYELLKEKTIEDGVYVAVIKSGENFEKIRFDDDLIKKIHLYECTVDMDINEIIKATTKGKTIKKIY